MREKFTVALFVVILVFLAVFSADIFHKLFIEVDDEFSGSAAAAFLGAFLAFVFVRIGDLFKSYSDRTTRNHSALIKLNFLLNGLMNELDDNVYIIDKFEESYQRHIESKELSNILVWPNRLHPVSRPKEIIIELINVDLINELFAFDIHLHKLNNSTETLNNAYAEIKNAMMSERITTDEYLRNLSKIRHDLQDMKSFLKASLAETKQSLSAVRILAKKPPLMVYLLKRIAGQKYRKSFPEERGLELSKLNEEIENTKKKGRDRINEIEAKK